MTYEGTFLEALAQHKVDEKIAATDKLVAGAYRDGLRSIKSGLGELFEKYSDDGALTYAEMSKYNRLNSLYSFLQDELKDITGRSNKDILRLSADAYEESFYRYGYALNQDYGLDIGFGLLNRDTIRAAVSFPVYGLPTSEILKKNEYELFIKAREEITRGLVLGESYGDMAARISRVLEIALNKALTVARTEATKSQTQGQLASYEYAQSKGVVLTTVWVATMDSHTRPAHVDLDGRSPLPDGLFHIDGDQG